MSKQTRTRPCILASSLAPALQPSSLALRVPWMALENLGCSRKDSALPSCTLQGRCGRVCSWGRRHGNVTSSSCAPPTRPHAAGPSFQCRLSEMGGQPWNFSI